MTQTYVLSKVTDQNVKPLVHIFNLPFSSGICPSEMKTAKVIPLFKSGDISDFNYRPISLLSQFSKVLEKLFNFRLEQFLISNEIVFIIVKLPIWLQIPNIYSACSFGINIIHFDCY